MFKSRLEATSQAARACLHGEISRNGALAEPMKYATGGGKGLRGFLVMECAHLHGVPDDRSVFVAAAIEAIHAYSLVHDDMPCMDDDDLRRGLPTVHKKWDDATAVLVGDALQTLAFELLTHGAVAGGQWRRTHCADPLAVGRRRAVGHGAWQALDIAAETAKAPLTLEEITHLQAGKPAR